MIVQNRVRMSIKRVKKERDTQFILAQEYVYLFVRRWQGLEKRERHTDKPFVCLQIALACFGNHFVAERWDGRLLVPVQRLEVVADVLLVETCLTPSGFIIVKGPEPGGVGRQRLVNEHRFAVEIAEFELRIGDDDATREGVGNRPFV